MALLIKLLFIFLTITGYVDVVTIPTTLAPTTEKPGGVDKSTVIIIVICVIGGVLLLIAIIVAAMAIRNTCRRRQSMDIEHDK